MWWIQYYLENCNSNEAVICDDLVRWNIYEQQLLLLLHLYISISLDDCCYAFFISLICLVPPYPRYSSPHSACSKSLSQSLDCADINEMYYGREMKSVWGLNLTWQQSYTDVVWKLKLKLSLWWKQNLSNYRSMADCNGDNGWYWYDSHFDWIKSVHLTSGSISLEIWNVKYVDFQLLS